MPQGVKMKIVELEDEIYEFIAKNTVEIGESASSILRRLLNIPPNGSAQVQGVALVAPAHELAELLAQPMFFTATTSVTRMLQILKEVHTQKKQDFEKVLAIQGRNRSYFAKSEQEILNSGSSTQPKEIDGTGYWVMTNSPTSQKQIIVREVLNLLNYSKESIEAAVDAINRK
jgi:negative modulator of initiation of replication